MNVPHETALKRYKIIPPTVGKRPVHDLPIANYPFSDLIIDMLRDGCEILKQRKCLSKSGDTRRAAGVIVRAGR